MRPGKKVKASAMQFAILVSVIVALLLSSFLLFTYTYSSYSTKSKKVLENIEASNIGIVYSCKAAITIVDSLDIVLEDVPVKISKNFWGSFELVKSRAGEGSISFEKAALIGSKSGLEKPGIYLEDNNLPLVLVGKTRIEGDAFTPEDIIKPGSIAGQYYANDQLVYGRRFRSSPKLPALDGDWKAYAQNMLSYVPDNNSIIVNLMDAANSFFNQPLVVYNTQRFEVNEKLMGNFILKSEIAVEVNSFSQLDQVIIIAPKVLIRNGFKGSLHIFAEEVELEDNVQLFYPSSIIGFEKEGSYSKSKNAFIPKITLGQNSLLEGNLIYFDSLGDDNARNDVLIGESAVVEGTVYCEGYIDLRGSVVGGVYTKFFGASQAGSLYINHIFNGQVLKADVKEDMSGILLAGETKNIAAWLY